MARFTKDEMFDELRTIFLFEADHVLISSGEKRAESYIGFPVGDQGEYFDDDPKKVDLSLFRDITSKFDNGYEFAFNPSFLNKVSGDGGDEVQDLNVFMLGTPRAGGIASGGETHRFMTPDGFCQTVTDAATARWKLEWSPGRPSESFTTRDLALLANMSEGAVRTAIADKSENRLKTIQGSKPISIEYDEAMRWLKGRRGFVARPEKPPDDGFLSKAFRNANDGKTFGYLIGSLTHFNVDEVARETGWNLQETKTWFDGTFAFDAGRATLLAKIIGVDGAMFAGKALEVSMRRNSGDQS